MWDHGVNNAMGTKWGAVAYRMSGDATKLDEVDTTPRTATACHHLPLLATTCHCSALLATAQHCLPLSTCRSNPIG